MPLTLASASPRRRELLGYLGVSFETFASDAEEEDHTPPSAVLDALPALGLPLGDHPTLRAWRKADAACAHGCGGVIIGCDTVVVLDGAALNKPADAADARAMLRRLSGRTHTVYSGLCVLAAPAAGGAWSTRLDLVATDVTFLPLSEEQIAWYVATGEPLDKAGAYGVQGLGGQLVRAVTGSYTSVVGLPLVALHRLLAAAGVGGLEDPADAYRRWLAAQGKEPLPCPPTSP